MRTRSRLTLLFFLSTMIACAARTEVADDDEDLDASSPDAAQDVTVPDVTPPPPPDDAQPPPPPPDDAEPPPPPPDDAEPPPPPQIDAAPPPPPPIDAGPPDAPETTCPDQCTSNHECENQCTPQLEQGRYCCDKQTSSCFAWVDRHCPTPKSSTPALIERRFAALALFRHHGHVDRQTRLELHVARRVDPRELHRHALNDLHEISRRVVRREQ